MIKDLQKANVWKRISAWLFDFMMLVVLAMALLCIGMLIFNTDQYLQKYDERMTEIYNEYGYEQKMSELEKLPEDERALFYEELAAPLEEKYEFHLKLNTELEVLTKEEREQYDKELEAVLHMEFGFKVKNQQELEELSEEERAKYDKDLEAVQKKEYADNVCRDAYVKFMSYFLMLLVLSIFIAYLVLELMVPLIMKNGQTLGKKIFGIAVMRIDGIKVSPLIMIVRTMLGKYTFETMVPLFCILLFFFNLGIMGLVVVLLLAIFEVVLFCVTKTNSVIHDVISSTVAVDMSSQRIFGSPEEREEYIKDLHEEETKEQF